MKAVKFKLFHFPASRSVRAKWALHEVLGEDFEVERVELYAGQQYAPDYLARNPNHAVPALQVTFADGSVTNMIESGAMVAWLADAFPDKRLAPPPDALSPERADYLQMLHFGASTMDMILWQIRVQEHLLPLTQQDRPTIERYRAKFANEVEPQLKRRIDRTAFVCGAAFTAADCIVGHNVAWARMYGMCGDDSFTHYFERLSERPACRQAFAGADAFDPALPDGVREVANFGG